MYEECVVIFTIKQSRYRHASVDHHNNRMRVSDILMDGGDDSAGDFAVAETINRRQGRGKQNSRSFQCLPPRSILSRWFSQVKKSKGRRTVVESAKVERERGREETGGEFWDGERKGDVDCSENELVGKSKSSVSEESGWHGKDASFNLGVGFGLVYLIAASRSELSKIMELRTQMEVLLQNVKEEVQIQRRDALSRPSYVSDNCAYSVSDAQRCLNSNGYASLQISKHFENPAEIETTAVCETLDCSTTRHEESVEGMDQLEAELQAELERLQLRLDIEYMLKHPNQQTIEISETAREGSPSLSFREVVDHPEAECREHFGVHPSELERRLHELLETRLQERIKELESDLEHAKLKIRKKETEVSWWKDTAQLISQHVPEISHLLR